MKVEYIDHMGSDLSVVNAARVSFDKESSWEAVLSSDSDPDLFGGSSTRAILRDSDAKLIQYLATHGHWSPFAHVTVSMRFDAPIYVARQLVKHQVGLSWNEVSRRYVFTSPQLDWPKMWRRAAKNVKQGSSDEAFDTVEENIVTLRNAIKNANDAVWYYCKLVEQGLCPEQARMFLPLNTGTEWIWTGSLYAWARVYNQRTDPHAQQETRQLVLTLDDICGKLYPVSWKALTQSKELQNVG